MRPRSWLRALSLSAAFCLCLGVFPDAAAGADNAAATPSPAAIEKAQQLFKKGAALFESERYALALEQFRASYATVASPNSRLYIARCLAELGELPEAYLEFEQVAEEAAERARTEPRYTATAQTAQLERDELAGKLALVTVTVTHDEAAASLSISGKEVPRARWGKPYPVKPGEAEIVVRSKVTSPRTQKVDLSPGETKSIAIDATGETAPDEGGFDADSPSRWAHLRPYAYVAGGVGVAGLVMFTAAGLMANGAYSDYSTRCRGFCPPGRQDEPVGGETEETVANVGLAVGAIGLAASATLLGLSFAGGGRATGARGAPASPQLVLGPGFAGVHATF